MKFQDLKSEKERERNLRSKNDNVLSREKERERNLWHGGSMRAVLRDEYDLRYWFCENETKFDVSAKLRSKN